MLYVPDVLSMTESNYTLALMTFVHWVGDREAHGAAIWKRTSKKLDATPDMTSQATSGRHLSKFKKRSRIPHPSALG